MLVIKWHMASIELLVSIIADSSAGLSQYWMMIEQICRNLVLLLYVHLNLNTTMRHIRY